MKIGTWHPHIRRHSLSRFLTGIRLFPLLAMIVAFAASPAFAQDTPVVETPEKTTEPSETADTGIEQELTALESKIAEAKSRTDEFLKLETAAKEGMTELPLAAIQNRLAGLNKLHSTLQQRQSVLRERRDLQARLAAAKADADLLQRMEEPPPYSLAFLDQMLDMLKAKRLEVEAETISLNAAKERAALERKDVDDAKANLNRASERLRTAGQEEREALAFEQETFKALLEAAQEEAITAQAEIERTETSLNILELDLKLTGKRVEMVRKQTLFRQQELDEIQERQREAVAGLEKEVEKAREEADQAKKKLAEVEQAVANSTEPDARSKAKRDLHLARMRVEATETEIIILESLRDIETGVGQLWGLRYQMHNPDQADTDPDWSRIISLLQERLDLFNKEINAGEQRANSLRGQITALENNLRDWGGQNGEKRFIEDQLNILSERILLRNRIQLRMNQAKALAERFVEEARNRQSSRPLMESLTEYGRKTYDMISLGFDREITEIGGESITGRKLFYMFLILLFGVILSRLLTRYIRNYALKRLRLRSNMVFIIAKLTNYATFIIVVYLALNYVNIPLTIFTFMGGAIALGVGFGAQNLINNFLSGLILMGEQPIRLGDIVEIEGKLGTVINIGTRASRLRMFNGYDLLIPNSKFLETSVINWTLSDYKVRLQVGVGVAYGSPTQEVARLMMQSVKEHAEVLLDPEPKVLFEAFGDNALQFTVYFWVEMKPTMDGRVVMSDIRYRIEALFKEAGIIIAYPQRDIHVDSIAPVEVHLVREGARIPESDL
jgi:small-conductance mechanosensitive channel